MPREALGVDGRRGDDDLEVGALRQDAAQVAEQEVDVERALVRLVDDDRVVAAQQSVAVDLVEQDAVGHQRHARVGRHLVGEAHLVADGRAERNLHLVGDALGDRARGDAARLGVSDRGAAQFEADLGQLRGLARAGGPGDDHDLVVADRARDLVPRGADGQLGRVDDDGFDRHSLPAYRPPIARVANSRRCARVAFESPFAAGRDTSCRRAVPAAASDDPHGERLRHRTPSARRSAGPRHPPSRRTRGRSRRATAPPGACRGTPRGRPRRAAGRPGVHGEGGAIGRRPGLHLARRRQVVDGDHAVEPDAVAQHVHHRG